MTTPFQEIKMEITTFQVEECTPILNKHVHLVSPAALVNMLTDLHVLGPHMHR